MGHFLSVLVCDDNARFASTLTDSLKRRLAVTPGLGGNVLHVESCVRLDEVRGKMAERRWDVILCDLGWGDMNLEGIQILHDIKIGDPTLFALLYTAQDEDDAVDQALQWKLGFIDGVVRIEGEDYLSKMLRACSDAFYRKRAEFAARLDADKVRAVLEAFVDARPGSRDEKLKRLLDETLSADFALRDLFPECVRLLEGGTRMSDELRDATRAQIEDVLEQLDESSHGRSVRFRGLRLLPKGKRDEFASGVTSELERVAERLRALLKTDDGEPLGADIALGSGEITLKLKHDPVDQKQKTFRELTDNLARFPRVEAHDLLALDKNRFIALVKNRYGGFPQMAEERGLDLNNIYRVNRKFKNMPFIVFKYETIREIVAVYENAALEKAVAELLVSPRLIRQSAGRAET